MQTLTQELLKELLAYNPDTGVSLWLPRSAKWFDSDSRCVYWNLRYAHTTAGCTCNGRVTISIFKTRYQYHRICWLYMTGSWPIQIIDHIDGNSLNNSFKNLRDIPQSGNVQNIHQSTKLSKSGVLGAHVNGSGFQARIKLNGRSHSLGTFRTPEEAQAAYISAKRKLHHFGML